MVFVTSWCVLQFALEKVLTGLLDDHEAKLYGFTRHFAIVCSPCHYTMKDNNLEVIWGNQNYYKWTTDGNLQFQAIPVMAGGGRSHLLSSILVPNWDGETQWDPLYMRRHGTTDSGRFGIHLSFNVLKHVETIQFWDPILTHTRWPWRSWAAHFWSQDAPLQGTFGTESAFGHPGKLTQRPLCQAEETFAWWEGKQTGGNDAVP